MRWLFVLAMACAVPIAFAQSPASPQDSGRQFEFGRGSDLENWQWRARYGVQLTASEQAVDDVVAAVVQRDCAAAVSKLNAGLAKAYPEVVLLAGRMYEEGICLKPNWDRAVTFYQRALNAGQSTAAARLAAGYAAPVGGRDRATALWWALRAKTSLPAECNAVASLVDDADRFVAALKAWPAGQLDACAYSAAVMAMILGELGSPELPVTYGVQGKIKLAFVPAEGRVDLAEDGIETAMPTGVQGAAGAAGDRNGGRKALLAYAKDVSDRALRRYERPTAVPPAWRAETELVLASKR